MLLHKLGRSSDFCSQGSPLLVSPLHFIPPTTLDSSPMQIHLFHISARRHLDAVGKWRLAPSLQFSLVALLLLVAMASNLVALFVSNLYPHCVTLPVLLPSANTITMLICSPNMPRAQLLRKGEEQEERKQGKRMEGRARTNKR